MVNYSKYSDQELFAALKSGNLTVFTQIYERYFALLYRHAYQMLHQKDQAEDVLQDVFQMLLEKRGEIELQHSLKAFLYASVRFRILKQFRHNKVVESYISKLTDLQETGIHSVDTYIEGKEIAQLIESGLSKLPAKMRQIFELSRIDELSYAEIAGQLDITEHTVKKQMSNALKIMRDFYKGSFILFF